MELLQQWTGEACFNKLASEAKQRKADGMVLVRQQVYNVSKYIGVYVGDDCFSSLHNLSFLSRKAEFPYRYR